MEQHPSRALCLLAALSALALAGCDKIAALPGNRSPSDEEIRAHLASRLPPELKLLGVEAELAPAGDARVAGNLKVTAAVREDLLAQADAAAVLRDAGLQFDQAQEAVRRLQDVPPPFADAAMPPPDPEALKLPLYRLVVRADQSFPIYAKCQAERIVDRWQFVGLQFGDVPQLKGMLRPQIQGRALVIGTPEADAALKSAVEAFNGYPAKVEAAIHGYMVALRDACAPGNRYAGTWRLRDQSRELELEFREMKMDGQVIRATLRDPAEPGAERMFSGRLDLKGSIKTGPIRLKSDPGSGRRTATDRYGRDWFYENHEISVALKLDPGDRQRLMGWRTDWDWQAASAIMIGRVGAP